MREKTIHVRARPPGIFSFAPNNGFTVDRIFMAGEEQELVAFARGPNQR